MSKVFVGNVFISTSRQAIEKLFFSKDRLPTLADKILTLTEKELKRSLIVTPNKNTNLISFDWSFGSRNADSSFLELKFIETDQLFEFFYINKTVGSTLMTNLIKEFRFNRSTGESYKRDIENELFNADTAILNDGRIFFAFGVGDDLGQWAGPFVADLFGSDIRESSDGIREIVLKYTTTSPFFLTNFVNSKNSNGLESAINKYKRVITNRRFIAARAEIEVEREVLEKDFHKYFTQLVKDYLTNCGNGSENIVILPNCDKIIQSNADSPTRKSVSDLAAPFGFFSNAADKQAKKKDQLNKLISDIGIGVNEVTVDGLKEHIPLTAEIAQEKFVKRDQKILKLSLDTKDQILDPEDPLPDFFWPLYIISNYFKEVYPTLVTEALQSTDFVFYEEANIKILKLWKKYKFIKDDNKPVIVFGSNNLIQHLLYLSNIYDFDALSKEPVSLGNMNNVDIDLYYNKGYRLEYFNQFIKTPIGSSFNEKVLIKDELALPDLTKELIGLAGIPVFRFNLPNSNVIGLDVKYENNYIGVYNLGFKTKALLPFINTNLNFIREQLNKDFNLSAIEHSLSLRGYLLYPSEPTNFNQLVDRITYWYDNVFLFEEDYIDKLSKKNLKRFSKKEVITYLALIMNSNLYFGFNLKKPFLEINGSEDLFLQNEILKDIESTALQVRIRTLPFFKLSSPSILGGKKVVLLGANNTIIGSTNKKRLMPYSGVYIINEFRHVIDEGDMYSEFTLNKLLESGLSESNSGISNGALSDLRSKLDQLSKEKNGIN
jgi:hypothetical protein